MSPAHVSAASALPSTSQEIACCRAAFLRLGLTLAVWRVRVWLGSSLGWMAITASAGAGMVE